MTKSENATIPVKESGVVEFKTSFNKEVIETVVAFSNTRGGKVGGNAI